MLPRQAAPVPAAAAPPPRASAASSRGARPAAQPRGNVRSLADMAKNQDDSDDDEQNEYYAGGEKSGQVRWHSVDAWACFGALLNAFMST